MPAPPLVSCIMPTFNRRQFVPRAIEYFLRQEYPNKELVIIDDGTDSIADLIPAATPQIRYQRLSSQLPLGTKRNLACQAALGDIIIHWDDDDWSSPYRIRYQAESLLNSEADIAGLDKLVYFDPESNKAWQYVYPRNAKPWVGGNSFCYRKSFWNRHPFPEVMIGEDSRFVWSAQHSKVLRLTDNSFLIGLIHASNVSPKRVGEAWWQAHSIEAVHNLLGPDLNFYQPASSTGQPRALVAASRGLGDILRVTPLIRVFHRLGYRVDVLLQPDYPETITLLKGAPEIARIFSNSDEISPERYEAAAFTFWSSAARGSVRSNRTWAFSQSEWLQDGDSRSIERIAREAGWTQPMPQPFACVSQRNFSLPPGTVAIHPGCKPDWPWKKWHGFDQLAGLLPNVALIGTLSDLENGRTYFKQPFHWPAHVRNYIGQLDLRDTAALISQCRALVSNDSGLMHLGVALGVPTLGVFGITSPERESIPAPNMFPITKGLACEPACWRASWGRRDCEHHLACLKTLTAAEVLEKLDQFAPTSEPTTQPTVQPTTQVAKSTALAMETLSLVYYGNAFDASGYGNAARGYIHALHSAGIDLSVVDTGGHPRQVHDALVESLAARRTDADFHLFHGIPTYWAREAFRCPNAIGMTVWETDTMPSQWRNILSHVLEVWLPCDFNVETFRRDLRTPIFKLPHPILKRDIEAAMPAGSFLNTAAKDFLFYGIFEWQERKSPLETMLAFLRAFPEEDDAVLVLKVNPGAASIANQALVYACSQISSRARIQLCCEAWSEAQIEALHSRGNCYISLHRGEGWNYPLFEAAYRGTPVIATAYSGPLEYLSEEGHHLIGHELEPVRQQYAYYNSRMRWANPNQAQAAQAMRCVYDNREHALEKARNAAPSLRRLYATESVGAMARARLMELLKRTQPAKWERLQRNEYASIHRPPVPIPGDWYDADYFETGVKSNWTQGYHWKYFSGLFRETAALLTDFFPEARSFLDIGCAKGFLVRALIEAQRECFGFDNSAWAIEHAEELARPFVQHSSVTEVHYDRQFDFLLALEVFEHLTEQQVVDFLSRARHWTRTGLFATIPSYDGETPPPRDENDKDLSHLTIRSRAWWHELILSAGWKQDPLHSLAQRACQTHPLPSKMGWQVYLYAPA